MLHVRPLFARSPRLFLEKRSFTARLRRDKSKDQIEGLYDIEIQNIYRSRFSMSEGIFSMSIGKNRWCAMRLYILIRNWAKSNAQHVNRTIIYENGLLRDKRPCGMSFNSRTDIPGRSRTNGNFRRDFAEEITSSSALECNRTKVFCETQMRKKFSKCKFQSASWNHVKKLKYEIKLITLIL